MNKTYNININGQVFTIDEDAYNVLDKYMKSLSTHFNRLGEQEVMTDIEARIAELINERLTDGKTIISIAIVNEVISIIGKLDQIDDDKDTGKESFREQAEKLANTASKAIDEKISKKLYRNPDDKIVAGVCSGVAAWSGINVSAIRILWVILCLFYALPLFGYIILWICLKEANTPIEKLEMNGQPVNQQTISDYATNATTKVEHSGCLGAFLKIIIVAVCICVLIAIVFSIASFFRIFFHIPFMF